MKSVLLSIKPEWCSKIATGKKTIEVRKSKPKLETPFKCYIYCTKGTDIWLAGIKGKRESQLLNGQIIGEFVCKKIVTICIEYSDADVDFSKRVYFPCTCLTDKQILDYLGNGNSGYGWCISELVIYDKPKELSEFDKTRPPQSWCYVEHN